MESPKELLDPQDDASRTQKSSLPKQNAIPAPKPVPSAAPPMKRKHKKTPQENHGQWPERQGEASEQRILAPKKNTASIEKPVAPIPSPAKPAQEEASVESPHELSERQNGASETQMILVPEQKIYPVTEPAIPGTPRPFFPIRKRMASLAELTRGETIILWTPAPISAPVVNRDLPKMPAIDRVMEVWRYSLLSGEYALSSNGLLREWFKLVVKIALFLMIPIFILVPIVTFFMASFSGISGYLLEITGNILWAMINILLLLLTALAAGIVFIVGQKLMEAWGRR